MIALGIIKFGLTAIDNYIIISKLTVVNPGLLHLKRRVFTFRGDVFDQEIRQSFGSEISNGGLGNTVAVGILENFIDEGLTFIR